AREISMMCCILIAWLRVHAGVSRATACQILAVLRLIIKATLALSHDDRASSGSESESVIPDVPLDDRTAIKRLDIEPELHRSVCCPRCFTAYNSDSIPALCTHKESQRAPVCNEPLMESR
ncbi:hypothetical protein BKA62DRAFT_604834, partial [Auriculariales sp. MPI-PUGE-AT-0066]